MPCGGDVIVVYNATCEAGSWKCVNGYRRDHYYEDCPPDSCMGYPPGPARCENWTWVCREGYVMVNGFCVEPQPPSTSPPAPSTSPSSPCGEEPPCFVDRDDGTCPGHCMPCGGDVIVVYNATCEAGSWKCVDGYRRDHYYEDCPPDSCLGYPPANSRCENWTWVCREGYVKVDGRCVEPPTPSPTPSPSGNVCCWGPSTSCDSVWNCDPPSSGYCSESESNCGGNCGGVWCPNGSL